MSIPQDSSTPVFGRSIGREVDRIALSGTSRKLDLEGSPRKPNPGDDYGTTFAEKAQRHLVIADHHLTRRKPRQAAAGDMAAGSESGCEDDAAVHWAVQLENLEARLETRLVTLMASVMEDMRKIRADCQERPKQLHSAHHDIKRELEAQRMEVSEQQTTMKESICSLQQMVTELKAEQQKQLGWVKAELEQRLKQILPSTNRSRSPVVRCREEASSVTAAPGSARGSSARGSSTEGRAGMKTSTSVPKSPVLRARGGPAVSTSRHGPVIPQVDGVIWTGNDRGMLGSGRRHQSASPKRPTCALASTSGFPLGLPCGPAPAPGAAEPPTPRSSAPNLRTQRMQVYRTPALPHRDLREISTSRTAVPSLPQSAAGTGSPQPAVRSVR